MEKTKYIIIKDGLVRSIIADIFSYGVLLSSFWINERFINGNNVLDILLVVMFFIFVVGQVNARSDKFNTPEDAIEYLKEIK